MDQARHALDAAAAGPARRARAFLSIRGKFALAFVSICCIVAAIGWFSVASMTRAGALLVETYDKPLMSISFARAIHADFASMEAAFSRRVSESDPATQEKLDADIEGWAKTLREDLGVARTRAVSPKVRESVDKIAAAFDAWQAARAAMMSSGAAHPEWDVVDRSAATVRDQIDLLVNYAAEDGFRQRKSTLAAIEDNRLVQIAGLAGAALLVALVMFSLTQRIIRPVAAASRAASRIAEGELDVAIEVSGRDEIAKLLGAMAIMRDNIRAMMEREIAQRRSAQTRLVDAIESSSEGVVLIDADRNVLLSNAEIEQFCGGPQNAPRAGDTLDAAAERVVGGGVFLTQTEQQRAEMLILLRRMEPLDLEAPLADGRWVRLARSTTTDGGAIFIVSDITLAKERENVLRDVAVRAEAANRAKTEFLATMSHELRTPLNAIIGFSEVLASRHAEDFAPAEYEDYAGEILASGRNLLGIINDILMLTKCEAGDLPLNIDEVDIVELAEDCEARVRNDFAAAGIKLSVDLTLEPLAVAADPVRLRQVLANLMSNALKFTPEGGAVRLSVRRGGGGQVVFAIADTGIGMAPEDIQVALSAFGQVDGGRSRLYEGTGLGLTLAKAIVELHGGALDVTSAKGAGTTVTVSLPVRRCAAAPGRSVAA
ncbi:Sensor histidine kinase RcsC [Alphaproteobacteria bacterium SO-S41]|nr:Sensor histidine kinase RcsC [Alphaproteobacteria bacterium SO-S41]